MNKLIFWHKNMSKEKKSAIVFVFATAISSCLNIITVPVFTRLMTLQEIGVVSLYSSWYSLIGVFATFSVTNTVVYVGFHDFKYDKIGFGSSLLGISSLFSIITTVFFILFRKSLSEILGISNSLVLLMLLSYLLLPAIQIWLCLQRYEYKYKKAFWLISLSAVLSTMISIYMVYKANNKIPEYRLWSMNFIPLTIAVFLYFYIFIKGKKFVNHKYWKYILSYNFPLILHYLSQYVLQSSDKIMIGRFYSETEVAIYTIAYSISNIILVFWGPINGVLIPYTHQCIDKKSTKNLSARIYKILLISSLGCVIVSLLSPEFILLLSTNEYLSGAFAIPAVTLSTLFYILFNVVANVEFMYGKTNRIAIMTIIAGLINIVLNMIFIPAFGFIAAAYTTLFSYAIYAYLHYINMIKLHGSKIFSGIKVLIIIGTAVILSLGSMFLYDYRIIRIVLVLFIGGVGIFLLKPIELSN